ncbi:MAG: M48 family metalloprotease [Sulfuricellaceae bacterium]|jgi:predicted Zn-dependent protease
MRISFFLILLLLCFPFATADDLPNLGDVSQSAMSPLEESKLGEQIMLDIHQDPTFFDDPEVTEYLNSLGYRLVSASPDNTLDFHFFTIRDNTLNAFALPGGYIGVHTGLIIAAQSESELASVLAHEIGHVVQHHLARMLARQQQNTLPTLAALAVAVLAARSNPQVSQAAMATAQAASVQTQLDFTREHEREADRVGLQILSKAGFDTRAIPAFFERLQRASRLYENNAPAYLRTHPLTSERIADIENRVAEMPYKQVRDSLDFQLVRAKLRALLSSPAQAVKEFESNLQDKRYASEAAQHYGLALALMRAKAFDRAETEIAALRKITPPNAIVDTLSADLKMAQGKTDAAIAQYRSSLRLYPNHRALVYGLGNALLETGRLAEAEKFVRSRLNGNFSQDSRLYELQAKIYAAEGKPMLSHQSQAEAYVRLGNLTAAIEQLQIALKYGSGDFYQQSIVEARLKELRRTNDPKRKP